MGAGRGRLKPGPGKKGGAETGPSPVDRGRPGSKHHLLVDGSGLPLAWRLGAGNRNDILQLLPLLDAVPAVAGLTGRPRRRPDSVLADRAYDHEHYLVELRRRGIKTMIARRYQPHGSGLGRLRWVVERTFAWISKHRRTIRDYEHLPASHEAMILWAMTALMTRRLAQTNDLSDTHLQPATIPCHPTTLRR